MPEGWQLPDNVLERFERWDGSGRPNGLSGASIPIEARIASIGEFVSARSHLSARDVVAEMNESSGTMFDPRLVEIVANNYQDWEKSLAQAAEPLSPTASAIRNAQRQADAWSGLAKSLNSAMTVAEVVEALKRHLPGMVGHRTLALWLKAEGGYRLAHGADDGTRPQGVELFASDRAELVLDTGQTVVGILVLEGVADNPDRTLLRHTMKRVATTLEIAIKYEAAERSASTDALTSLPNSRSLYRRLARELAQSKRAGAPFSVLVSDLDGFKDVNDQYGHLRGNELLAEIAVALQNACREYDFVARLSGDEFVLILPGATGEVSERRSNVLRGVIEKAAERLIPGCGVTASIGIAAFPADGVEAHELLAKADRAMYAQKAASPRIRPFLASGRIWPTATPLPKPLIN